MAWDFICPPKAKDRLIVALDVATRDEAQNLVSQIGTEVSFFKVGYQLFVAEGMALVRDLMDAGHRVFLDLKMDDVEATVTLAVREIAQQGATFLTIHGNGATARAARAGIGDKDYPKILSVTLLSSLDAADLRDLGILGPGKRFGTLDDYVDWRAEQAVASQCDGLIVSGPSIARIRGTYPNIPIISPGIRLLHTNTDDHKRSTTPYDAIRHGATYLVVGRPIRDAANPAAVTRQIIADIDRGLADQASVLPPQYAA